MNSVKIFLLTISSFFLVGLHCLSIAMERAEKGKEIIGVTYQNWDQALNALSKPSNWKRNFPTDEWMRDAIDPAVESIQQAVGPIQQDMRKNAVINELDSALRKHYGSGSLSIPQSSALKSIKRDFLANVNNALETAYEQERQQQERIKQEQRIMKRQPLQEVREEAAHYEQKEDIQKEPYGEGAIYPHVAVSGLPVIIGAGKELIGIASSIHRLATGESKLPIDPAVMQKLSALEEALSTMEAYPLSTAKEPAYLTELEEELGWRKALLQDKYWYKDPSITQKWIENSVPTEDWMENAAQAAVNVVEKEKDAQDKQTKEREIILFLYRVLDDHYKFSKLSTAPTIDRVIQKFVKLMEIITDKLYPELAEQKRAQTALAIRRAEERAEIEAGIKAHEEFEAAQEEFERKPAAERFVIAFTQAKEKQRAAQQSIEQFPLYEQFKKLLTLDSVGKGWFRSPLPRWKDDIVQAAFELLYGRVDDMVINVVVNQINEAITNYAKTKSYSPDWVLIAMDSKEIGDKITTLLRYDPSRRIEPTFINKLLFPKTISEQEMYEQAIKKSQQHDIERAQKQELQEFTQTFKDIAQGVTDEGNTPDKDPIVQHIQEIYWIFNPIKTYYDLNPITLEKIVDKAVALIKVKNVPLKMIENMMDKELQEARKGKSPKFRSAAGLGIIKAIKKQL